MPGQKFGAGFEVGSGGHVDLLPVENPVLHPVVEFFLDAVTDFKTMVGCDRDIPGIEKPVDVGPKEQAVFNFMGTAFAKGFNMGCLQGRKGLFPGNGATPLISVRHQHSEAPLPQMPQKRKGRRGDAAIF